MWINFPMGREAALESGRRPLLFKSFFFYFKTLFLPCEFNYRVLQKKGYYFGWALFGENLNNKLNMRAVESQRGWIMSVSQTNFLQSTCLICAPFLLKHAFTQTQKLWPTFFHASAVTSAAKATTFCFR